MKIHLKIIISVNFAFMLVGCAFGVAYESHFSAVAKCGNDCNYWEVKNNSDVILINDQIDLRIKEVFPENAFGVVSHPYFLFIPVAGWSSDTPNVDGVVVNILINPKTKPVEVNLGEIIFNTPSGETVIPASYLEHVDKAEIICKSTLVHDLDVANDYVKSGIWKYGYRPVTNVFNKVDSETCYQIVFGAESFPDLANLNIGGIKIQNTIVKVPNIEFQKHSKWHYGTGKTY